MTEQKGFCRCFVPLGFTCCSYVVFRTFPFDPLQRASLLLFCIFNSLRAYLASFISISPGLLALKAYSSRWRCLEMLFWWYDGFISCFSPFSSFPPFLTSTLINLTDWSRSEWTSLSWPCFRLHWNSIQVFWWNRKPNDLSVVLRFWERSPESILNSKNLYSQRGQHYCKWIMRPCFLTGTHRSRWGGGREREREREIFRRIPLSRTFQMLSVKIWFGDALGFIRLINRPYLMIYLRVFYFPIVSIHHVCG